MKLTFTSLGASHITCVLTLSIHQ